MEKSRKNTQTNRRAKSLNGENKFMNEKKSAFGLLKDKIVKISDDFDAPLLKKKKIKKGI